MQRRHHYERAFEGYLRDRRIPYVAVSEARKTLLPVTLGAGGEDASLKSFDFVVYGQNTNLLVDIKGRKVGPSTRPPPRPPHPPSAPRTTDFSTRRLESWVTEDDVASLRQWQTLFGEGFEAAFVFVYWFGGTSWGGQPPDALFQEVLEDRGEWYALRVVRVEDYRRAMKPRSPRWRTVDVAARVFERISQPLAPALGGPGAGVWSSSSDAGRGEFDDAGPDDAALFPLSPLPPRFRLSPLEARG
ncbi:MAG: HYExAFE family protein [Phycisphaerales bacterium]|nr:HYExAFE family protein [Phycisphaerales bacterium]